MNNLWEHHRLRLVTGTGNPGLEPEKFLTAAAQDGKSNIFAVRGLGNEAGWHASCNRSSKRRKGRGNRPRPPSALHGLSLKTRSPDSFSVKSRKTNHGWPPRNLDTLAPRQAATERRL